MKDKELENLKNSIANLQSECKQLQADMGEMPDTNMKKHMDDMYSMIYRMTDGIYQYIDRVANRLYEHASNGTHLPPINGPGQMATVLKKLEMNSDYDVKPRVIYASKNDVIVEASYQKPK